MLLADLENGARVADCYLLSSVSVRTSSNGSAYLSGTLSDQSGSLSVIMWQYNGSLSEKDNGCVVYAEGRVSEYKGALQITASKLFPASEGEYDVSALVPVAPIDADARLTEVEEVIASIPDADYRRLTEAVFSAHRDQFSVIPAAKSVHHAFRSGLLMHTSNMLRLALSIADIYSDVVDRSLLIAGTVLHDIAKVSEFVLSPLGLATDYSLSGDLLGHPVMGAMEVAAAAEKLGIPQKKSVLLQHLLLSHHGEPEFGAAVLPQCVEAEILSRIDMLDSRVEIYADTLSRMQPGETTGKPVFGLDHRIYSHF